MAKRECISSLVEIEHRLFLLRTFVTVVQDCDPNAPPDWTLIASELLSGLESEVEAHGKTVRGARC